MTVHPCHHIDYSLLKLVFLSLGVGAMSVRVDDVCNDMEWSRPPDISSKLVYLRVTHPVFDASSALLPGLEYNVSVRSAVPHSSVLSYSLITSGGSFTHHSSQSTFCSQSHLVSLSGLSTFSAVWFLPFPANIRLSTPINFRALLRLKNGTRLQAEITREILKECRLTMLPGVRNLSSTSLPATFTSCHVTRYSISDLGQLVQVTRLSLPGVFGLCSRALSVEITSEDDDSALILCGKLSALPFFLGAVRSRGSVVVHTRRTDVADVVDFLITFSDRAGCVSTEREQQFGSFLMTSDVSSCQLKVTYPLGHQVRLKVDTVNFENNEPVLVSINDGLDSGWYRREIRNRSLIESRASSLWIRFPLLLTRGVPFTALLSWQPSKQQTTNCKWPHLQIKSNCWFVSIESVDQQTSAAKCRGIGSELLVYRSFSTEAAFDQIQTILLTIRSEETFWLHRSDNSREQKSSQHLKQPGEECWFLTNGGSGVGTEDRTVETAVSRNNPSLGSGPCSVHRRFICFKPIDNLRNQSMGSSFPHCNSSLYMKSVDEELRVMSTSESVDLYSHNIDCRILVFSPPGSHLFVIFRKFHLENDIHCNYDWLQIFDNGTSRKKLCGDWRSKLKLLHFSSASNYLEFRFHSDFANSFAGFEALVRIHKAENVCRNKLCLHVHHVPLRNFSEAVTVCRESQSRLMSSGDMTGSSQLLELLHPSTYWLDRSTVGQCDCLIPTKRSKSVIAQTCTCSLKLSVVCLVHRAIEAEWPRFASSPGTLSSPGFPGAQYPVGLDLTTSITAPLRSWILVHVQLHLEHQELCLYDFVRISWKGGEELLCGNLESRRFYIKANTAQIRFVSDQSVTAPGFSLTWSPLDVSPCDGGVKISPTGRVHSVGYPDFAPPGLSCTYYISTPGYQYVLMRLSASKIPCSSPWLEISSLEEAGFPIASEDHLPPFAKNQHVVPSRSMRSWCIRSSDRSVLLSGTPLVKVRHRANEQDSVEDTKRKFLINYTAYKSGETIYMGTIRVGDHDVQHHDQVEPLQENLTYNVHYRFVAEMGYNVEVQISFEGVLSKSACRNQHQGLLISDVYGPRGRNQWWICAGRSQKFRHLLVRSQLHVIYIIHRYGAGQSHQQQQNIHIEYILAAARNDSSFDEKTERSGDVVENCRFKPCLHEGKCVHSREIPSRQATCICAPGYYGRFCQFHACWPSPCIYGQCQLSYTSPSTGSTGGRGYVCKCRSGHTGQHCDLPESPCSARPCQARGFCYEVNNTFRCRCHAWWFGRRCEKRLPSMRYRPLSERMLREPFWLGLIAITVVLIIIGIFWCIKKHFAERIERFFAEEIERSKYNYYIPSPSPSHARIRDSPPHSPMPARSLLNKLSFRKRSRMSLLSLSSITSSPGRELRRSTEDFFRFQLRRNRARSTMKSQHCPRTSSAESQELARDTRFLLRGLATPTMPLNQRSRSCDEVTCLPSESHMNYLTVNSSLDSNSGSQFQDIILSKLDKKVKFANLMAQISREMAPSSESDLSLQSDLGANKRPTGYLRPKPFQLKRLNPVVCTSSLEDAQDTFSVSSDITSDFSVKKKKLMQSLSTPSSPHQRPLNKIISADNILTMLRTWSTKRSSSTPESPVQSEVVDDHSLNQASPQDGRPLTSGQSNQEKLSGQTIEIPVLQMGSKSNHTIGSVQSVTLEIPSMDYRCLSPITEVPTPSPSPLPTPSRHARHPITINTVDAQYSGMDSSSSSIIEELKFSEGRSASNTSGGFLSASNNPSSFPTPCIPSFFIESPKNDSCDIKSHSVAEKNMPVNVVPEIRVENEDIDLSETHNWNQFKQATHSFCYHSQPNVSQIFYNSSTTEGGTPRKRGGSVQYQQETKNSTISKCTLSSDTQCIRIYRSNSEPKIMSLIYSVPLDIEPYFGSEKQSRAEELGSSPIQRVKQRSSQTKCKKLLQRISGSNKKTLDASNTMTFRVPDIVVQEASSISPDSSSEEEKSFANSFSDNTQDTKQRAGYSKWFGVHKRPRQQPPSQLQKESVDESKGAKKGINESISTRGRNILARWTQGKSSKKPTVDCLLLKRETVVEHSRKPIRRRSFNIPFVNFSENDKLQTTERFTIEKYPSVPNLAFRIPTALKRQKSVDKLDCDTK